MSKTGEPTASEPADETRPSAQIHYLYDWFDPPLQAVISNARRLQDYLIATGAIGIAGAPLPFPELAPSSDDN